MTPLPPSGSRSNRPWGDECVRWCLRRDSPRGQDSRRVGHARIRRSGRTKKERRDKLTLVKYYLTAGPAQTTAGTRAAVRILASDGAGVREGAALGTSALPPWVFLAVPRAAVDYRYPPVFAMADRSGRGGLPGRALANPRRSPTPDGTRRRRVREGACPKRRAPHGSDRRPNPQIPAASGAAVRRLKSDAGLK